MEVYFYETYFYLCLHLSELICGCRILQGIVANASGLKVDENARDSIARRTLVRLHILFLLFLVACYHIQMY